MSAKSGFKTQPEERKKVQFFEIVREWSKILKNDIMHVKWHTKTHV